MPLIQRVDIAARPLTPFAEIFGAAELQRVADTVQRLSLSLQGGVIWNINSTPRGGGVAEMLRPLVGYARGAGVDCRWLVLGGNPEFFTLTKRIHHALHGSPGDGQLLDDEQRATYERTLLANAGELLALIEPGDVVLLHDPQTAGLVEPLLRHGARVIWRCHIGTDRQNDETRAGWSFLGPYISRAEACIFTRRAYVPALLRESPVTIIAPSIDPTSTKNRTIKPEMARAILGYTGLLEGPTTDGLVPMFYREDGSASRLCSRADVLGLGRAARADTPMIVQVSRWDPLKDHVGVMHGFARLAATGSNASLMLVGPNVHAVADDPEGAGVYAQVVDAWRALPQGIRSRVHLANLPMADAEENAAIVNALQTHATIVVQKSLEEGFGLTVTEAMWKGRPVVASRVGGIQDQIEHEQSGILLDDPRDPGELARALERLLREPDWAERLGANAHERVRNHFLSLRSLYDYADLVVRVTNRDLSPRAGDSHADVMLA